MKERKKINKRKKVKETNTERERGEEADKSESLRGQFWIHERLVGRDKPFMAFAYESRRIRLPFQKFGDLCPGQGEGERYGGKEDRETEKRGREKHGKVGAKKGKEEEER